MSQLQNLSAAVVSPAADVSATTRHHDAASDSAYGKKLLPHLQHHAGQVMMSHDRWESLLTLTSF